MGLKILCSGYLIRYPLGGFSWHHLQYLLGFLKLDHEVMYFEDYGWNESCYDPLHHKMTNDAGYGLTYFDQLLKTHQADIRYSYLAQDGQSHGMSREELAQRCCECDVYFNLSNINWIPELNQCRKRILVDTDPVFTQIKAHGLGGPSANYDVRFTYGENVGQAGCSMPDGGMTWLPTRQPVVMDCWEVTEPPEYCALTTVMNWSAYGEHEYQGKIYGQKNRELERYFSLPQEVDASLCIAMNTPEDVKRQLERNGWRIMVPLKATLRPEDFQSFIAESMAEFSVAKHGYVATQSGWFSDRSCGYLASGRPVILQDTGFSRFLPSDQGLVAFRTYDEAKRAILKVCGDPQRHAQAARRVVEEFFESGRVLSAMLEKTV